MRSCRNGVPVVLVSSTKAHVSCKLTVHTRDLADEVQHVVQVQCITLAEALDERRLSLIIDATGVIQSASSVPLALFGLKPAGLVGRNLCEIVDILKPLKDDEEQLRNVLSAIYTR